MAAAVEAKERAHAQGMNDLERKFLTEKGNLQKVTLRSYRPFPVSLYLLTNSSGRQYDIARRGEEGGAFCLIVRCESCTTLVAENTLVTSTRIFIR